MVPDWVAITVLLSIFVSAIWIIAASELREKQFPEKWAWAVFILINTPMIVVLVRLFAMVVYWAAVEPLWKS